MVHNSLQYFITVEKSTKNVWLCVHGNQKWDTLFKLTFFVLIGLTEMAIPLPGITANGLHC